MIQFSSEILFVKILTYGIGDGKGISWELCLSLFIGSPLLHKAASPAIPTDMLRFLFVAHAFLLMFCATRPTGSDRHKT